VRNNVVAALIVLLAFDVFSNRMLQDAAINHDMAKTKKSLAKILSQHVPPEPSVPVLKPVR
jgi:hypothetical protein